MDASTRRSAQGGAPWRQIHHSLCVFCDVIRRAEEMHRVTAATLFTRNGGGSILCACVLLALELNDAFLHPTSSSDTCCCTSRGFLAISWTKK